MNVNVALVLISYPLRISLVLMNSSWDRKSFPGMSNSLAAKMTRVTPCMVIRETPYSGHFGVSVINF